MLLQDLATLQNIPGYLAILKAVLKAQIQELVEQLHEQGGEETFILTASIQEGTLCHLGSNRGQGFLSGRDDIKSQFLAYCQQDQISEETNQKLYPLYYRNFDSLTDEIVQATSVYNNEQGHKQPASVPMNWTKTVPEQRITVVDQSPRKFTSILGESVGGVIGKGREVQSSVSLLDSRTDQTTNGLFSSVLIEDGNPTSLLNGRNESSSIASRIGSSLVENTLDRSCTIVDHPVGDSVIANVQALVASDVKTGQCDASKPIVVDIKDKNKKTLSSKIEEITERIKKDETQRTVCDDSGTGQALMEMSQDVTVIGDSSQLKAESEVISTVADTVPAKFRDVSRASHRKPKQPRFNIGVASDEEDSEVIKKTAGLSEDVLNITVNMDDTDTTFTAVSLDDLGDGVLLKENVTDIPIVEYNNGEELDKTVIEGTFNLKPNKSRKTIAKRFSQAIRVYGSNKEKKWLKCCMCPEKFTTQEDLNSHLQKVVHMPKKCECDFCGRTFGQLRDMERHRRIHTGEKPFTCDICNRSFARKDNLKSHKLNHLRKQLKMQGCIE